MFMRSRNRSDAPADRSPGRYTVTTKGDWLMSRSQIGQSGSFSRSGSSTASTLPASDIPSWSRSRDCVPTGHRTTLLKARIRSVAERMTAVPGARLLADLGIKVSHDTLTRQVRAGPGPGRGDIRVLGVDDFYIGREKVYGTILINLETRKPVDVLPDRESDTLAAWLRANPGIEIICRDRGGAYADGARRGAPNAIQVADRFHLWQNLRKAITTDVRDHRAELDETTGEPPPANLGETHQATRTRERFNTIQHLVALGIPQARICSATGLSPGTVKRFARAQKPEEFRSVSSPAAPLEPFKPYLRERFTAGHTKATILFKEIRERGYTGSLKTLRRYLKPFRAHKAQETSKPPRTRDIARWLITDPKRLTPQDAASLKAVLTNSPALTALTKLVRDFATMMRSSNANSLTQWIEQTQQHPLAGLNSYAQGLKHDLAAVINGITLPWSSGQVEGHVNRIKLIKRQMYGRASFDLLRLRILVPT